jgi:hypothetical protein
MENSAVVESGASQEIPALHYPDPIDPFLESTQVHELILELSAGPNRGDLASNRHGMFAADR